MKLYKIHRPECVSASNEAFAPVTKFEGTHATARATRLNLEEPFKPMKPKERPVVTVTEVDVPTDKAGLIAYLNKLVA